MVNQALFLGSEGTRFLGQTTVDIQLNNWLIVPEAMERPVRQSAVAVAQGITVVVPEESNVPAVPPNGPPQEGWVVAPIYLQMLEFNRLGPSPPNALNLPAAAGRIHPHMHLVNGVQLVGFDVPWYYEVEERYPNHQFFYYKHKKRAPNAHEIAMPLIPSNHPQSKMIAVDYLRFGTQINVYRQGRFDQ
ncbi:hypothetical protein J3R83DRAFT_5529 [Lanmaoa asiatica]|nr:hypothetical protein J3R83DRAFT_5529 [Lanmaoa asiatica]